MRDDKSLCKCYGREHKSLAYNWRFGREMVLGSLQCLGVLLFWVIVGQGPAVLAFLLSYILSYFIFFHFSADTAWSYYNVYDWAID